MWLEEEIQRIYEMVFKDIQHQNAMEIFLETDRDLISKAGIDIREVQNRIWREEILFPEDQKAVLDSGLSMKDIWSNNGIQSKDDVNKIIHPNVSIFNMN